MQEQRLRIFIAKKIRGLLAGEHLSHQLNVRGYDLEEKRKFRLGDDPRRIDIMATAKKGDDNPRVSINRIEKGANLVFLIDCSASMRFGKTVGKYQYAIGVTREIATACSGNGNRLRFIAFDAKIRHDSQFLISPGSAMENIDTISQLPHQTVETDLSAALTILYDFNNQLNPNLPSLVFIISDFLFKKEINKELEKIYQLSDIILLVLKDPAELSLPKPRFGLVKIVDPETGQIFFARESVNSIDKLLQILKRYYIDCLEVNTGEDIGLCLENLAELFENKKEEG